MDFLQLLGIMAGPVIMIVGLVELIKFLLKEKISVMVNADKKKLDIIWLCCVAILSIGASIIIILSNGWNWWKFLLAAPAYLVGAVGTYVAGRIVFPWTK